MDNRIKIFIVEDEALIADEIRRALEGLGYEVSAICYDFDSAMEAIPTADADLFVLDINLGGRPGQDGIALAEHLKTVQQKPFIFLTAYSDKDTIARATAQQPANYLLKPVNPAALFAAIQLAIARMQEPQEVQDDAPTAIPDFFYVKIGVRKKKFYWEDVYGMEASKNYVCVFIKGHVGSYPVRGTVTFVLDQLVPKSLRSRFFRLGRGLCLNRMHITAIEDNLITCGDRQFKNDGRMAEEDLIAIKAELLDAMASVPDAD